jgi:hypothetical protein
MFDFGECITVVKPKKLRERIESKSATEEQKQTIFVVVVVHCVRCEPLGNAGAQRTPRTTKFTTNCIQYFLRTVIKAENVMSSRGAEFVKDYAGICGGSVLLVTSMSIAGAGMS